MKLLNKEQTDYSNEIMIGFGVMLECVWTSEIIAYKMADTMDRAGLKNTFVQDKKMHFNRARKNVEGIIKDLEIAFDETFNRCGQKASGYTDEIQEEANDIAKLLLIYYARGDGDWERKDKMKAALLNFKPKDDIDLDGLLKYFKLQ